MTRLAEARDLITRELAHWTDLRDGVEHGLQKAVAAGLIVEARCTCPVGFGQVRAPDCPMHGSRAPAHTITGPAR